MTAQRGDALAAHGRAWTRPRWSSRHRLLIQAQPAGLRAEGAEVLACRLTCLKVNGRKRHIAVGTTGLVLDVVITAASVQDRQAARPLLWNLHRACRRVRLVWADAGYTGKLSAWATAMKMTLRIVSKRDPHAFEVLPRRWVVERTFAWISKHRRTTRDYERLPASHEAMILRAMIVLMARRLAQPANNQALTYSDLKINTTSVEAIRDGHLWRNRAAGLVR